MAAFTGTTTTLSSAALVTDPFIVVASATNFAAGSFVEIDEEKMQILQTYTSGTTIPVRRGVDGTFPAAHPATANVNMGTATQFSGPSASQTISYPIGGVRYKQLSYSASGAITLPQSREWTTHILNGTSVLAMTVAVPTKDNDGAIMFISSNGVAAHTITFTGGLSGGGTSYDVLTVNSGAPITVGPIMAINGLWQLAVAVPMAGTVTNLTGTIG